MKSKEVETLRGLFYYKEGLLYNKVDRHKNPKDTPIANKPNSDGYITMEANNKNYKVHRIIYAIVNGYFPEEVDHINGDVKDNRIENLRGCSHRQNCTNIKQKTGVSGVQGVSCFGDKWRARLSVNGKRFSLGLYDDSELAEFVVAEARDKYHGVYNVLRRA